MRSHRSGIGLVTYWTKFQCVLEIPKKSCFIKCELHFNEHVQHCPCFDGCLTGCPCPNYDCGDIGDKSKFAMLFLCTSSSRNWFNSNLKFDKKSKNSIKSNTPRLIDTAGELSTTFDFDGYKIERSGGVTFQNKQYIFGGRFNSQQILRLDDCGLVSIGLTPFVHYYGASGSTDAMIILCFNVATTGDSYRCRQASSPIGPWSEMTMSMYEHQLTSIATSPGNQARLVINSKVERNRNCRLNDKIP